MGDIFWKMLDISILSLTLISFDENVLQFKFSTPTVIIYKQYLGVHPAIGLAQMRTVVTLFQEISRWGWREVSSARIILFGPGWQKLRGSTGGTRRKVWTETKILSSTPSPWRRRRWFWQRLLNLGAKRDLRWPKNWSEGSWIAAKVSHVRRERSIWTTTCNCSKIQATVKSSG